MDLSKLSEPFPENEVKWRIGQAGKGSRGIWAKLLAYIDARAVMDRLDEVCGIENWRNEFKPAPCGGNLCGISIKIDGEWVTKWDGAENTDIEEVKGGLSDSFKRAAVQWGIGRYLYNFGETWADVNENGKNYANCKIRVNGKEEYVNFKWDAPKSVGGKSEKPKGKPADKPKSNGKPQDNPSSLSIDSIPEEHREYCMSAVADISNAASLAELSAMWSKSVVKRPKPVQDFLLPLFSARKNQVTEPAPC